MTSMDACKSTIREKTHRNWPLIRARWTPCGILIVGVMGWGMISAYGQAPNQGGAPNAINPRTARLKATPAPRAATTQQKLVAVVNGEQITRQQLGNECIRRYGEDVLESMLNKYLIFQECKRRNILITEADVEAEIEGMAKKFGLAVDRWLTMLEKERDISASKYRRDIIWPTLALRQLAATNIQVTEDELSKSFESEYGPKVKARLISVSSRQKAEEIRRAAAAKPDRFGELAKEHSEDANSAAARGLIPAIRKHAGHQELERVAFGLKEGEISPVLHVFNQYVIIKCEGHLKESYISPDQIKRVEAQLHDQIRDRKLREAAGTLFQKLQDSAKVVNIYQDPQLRQDHPGIAAMVNGQTITMQKLAEECLLRHGKDVVEGEINRLVLQQELRRRRRSVTNEAIDNEIARAAAAYGYLDSNGGPDVKAWLDSVTESDSVTIELYVHDAVWPSVALKLLVGDTVSVTAEDLDRGFAANYGERVEALAIVLSNQRTANMVWEMARNNSTDAFFGELAQQYSIEPVSKANFGKIPPIRRFGGQPVVEEEAFRLQAGELSGIISIADKYIILRCLGRTKPVVQEFADVESELRADIHEKKLRLAMAEEFDRLKEAAQIDNFIAGSSQAGSREPRTNPAGRRATRSPAQPGPPRRNLR